MSGKVTTSQKNGDVTGENGRLDEPAEVITRGNQLAVVNMNMAWATPGLSVDAKVDGKGHLSVIDLPTSRWRRDAPRHRGGASTFKKSFNFCFWRKPAGVSLGTRTFGLGHQLCGQASYLRALPGRRCCSSPTRAAARSCRVCGSRSSPWIS